MALMKKILTPSIVYIGTSVQVIIMQNRLYTAGILLFVHIFKHMP